MGEQPILKNDIYQLLQRSLKDEDDEVRDRATLYCALLENFKEIKIVNQEEKENKDDDDEDLAENEDEEEKKTEPTEPTITIQYEAPKELVGIIKVDPLDYSLRNLESSLLVYLNDNTEKEENKDSTAFDKPFGTEDVDKYIKEEHDAKIPSIGGE